MDSAKRLAIEGTKEACDQTIPPRTFEQLASTLAWDLIADKVLEVSAEDYQHLVNSSIYFQNLRATCRTTALFQEVLPLVALSIWSKDGIEGFSPEDVLKCRQVCKKWDTAVQKVVVGKFHGFGGSYFGIESEDLEEIETAFKRIKSNTFLVAQTATGMHAQNNWNEVQSVHRFLEHFGEDHGPTNRSKGSNPFFCRDVKIFIDQEFSAAEYDHFLQGINLMFSTYGTQVENFRVIIQNNDDFSKTAVALMPEWLSLLPNLKLFTFDDNCYSGYGEINLEAADAHPFPKLEFLEKIKILQGPLQLRKSLIQQSSHISKLLLRDSIDCDLFRSIPLPKLRFLAIAKCRDDIAEQLNSPQVQWPLEFLVLTDLTYHGGDDTGYSTLFKVIQDKFADTLVSLGLDVNDRRGASCEGDFRDSRLDLPNLKDIHFDLGSRTFCLDFLLPMSNNLESITVSKMYPPCRKGHSFPAIIQYTGFEEKMLESNIWGIFKKLNKFKVLFGRCYFRQEWMHKMSRMRAVRLRICEKGFFGMR